MYDGYNYYWYYYGYYFTINPGCYQPAITSQPPDQAGCVGFPTTFTAGVDKGPGTPSMRYEWYKGTSLIYTSTTSQSYTISSVTANDAGQYKLRVVNTCGKQIDSRTLTFTVNTPATITTQPIGATVCPGTNYTMSVAATGTTLRYQWQKDGNNIVGATNASYSITGATVNDGGIYKCLVTAICGLTRTSADAVIIVPSPPIVTQQPQGGGYCPGSNVVVTPGVSGTGLSFQWYKGPNPVVGQTSITLAISNFQPDNSGYYWLKITGGAGACISTTNTDQVNLYTYGAPVVSEQPKSTEVCAGSTLQLSVTAEGTGLTYQWYRNGSPIANSNNYSLVLNNTTTNMSGAYTVDISSVCSFVTRSSVATVNVVTLPTISSQPTGMDIQVGQAITLSVGASNATEIIWYLNEKEIARGTEATYMKTNATVADAGFYRAVITNACGSITTRNAKVTVTDPASLVPLLTITSEALNAGEVPFGYHADRMFNDVVLNTGTANLDVTSIGFTGAQATDFNVVNNGAPFTLMPGEARTITIQYRPSRIGSSNAQVVFTSNANPSSSQVAIHGSGVLLYNVSTALAFGEVEVGRSLEKCLQLNNTSSVDVTIDQVLSNSTEFVVTTTTPLTIPAGGSMDVCVTFTPTQTGARQTVLDFRSSTGGNSNTNAAGTGVPFVSVDNDALAAGFTVYPNPTTGVVTITTGEAVAKSISLVNLNGQTVATVVPTAPTHTWDLVTSAGASIPSGTYTLRIVTVDGTFSMPIAIAR
jgi:hypothetical protein